MSAHRPAPMPIRWWLRVTGFAAIVMPWSVAYYSNFPPPEWLQRHEQVHLDQIARMGALPFLWRYLIGLVRHGYWNHPMEIEARGAE